MNEAQKKVLGQLNSSWSFLLWKLFKLPSLFFWRVKLMELSKAECRTSVPKSWRTQNPFGSTYFAALAGAAELSTGALVLLHISGHGRWSMYVVDYNIQYVKRATETAVFECLDGLAIENVVQEVMSSGQPKQIETNSIGRTADGTIVATAKIMWSLKKK